jgi:sugar/nucleoside kinase (ribokinase family)
MIVGLGLVNLDLVAVVPRWDRDEKVQATHFFEQVGGPVPVALTAMARLGTDVPPVMLGVVAADRDGAHATALLAEDGVDVGLVERAPGVATSKSLVLLDTRDGSRTLANYAEDLPPLTLTASHRDLLARASLLHLDGRDLPASLEAARLVRAAGGLVSLDLGTMRPGREELIALCDIVIASRKGGAGAFPDAAGDPEEQVRRFLRTGAVRVAGVTLGQAGVVIGERGSEPVHLPAFPVPDAVDTCGAGDLFHGAFLWAYTRGDGRSVIDSARFACAAVAVRIRRYGNRAGLPTLAEVEST